MAAADAARGPLSASLETARETEDVLYLPPSDWIRAASLGHTELASDLLLMRFRVYYGDHIGHWRGARYAFDYVERAIELDPDNAGAYEMVPIAAMWSRDDDPPLEYMLSAVSLMERGVERFPQDGDLAWSTAAMILYEMVPILKRSYREAAERLRARGLPFLERAALLGSAPEWTVFLTARWWERLGEVERRIEHYQRMYTMTDDPDVRARIASELATLQHAHALETANAFFENEEARWRADFPHLPLSFYRLLGAPEEFAPLGDQWNRVGVLDSGPLEGVEDDPDR